MEGIKNKKAILAPMAGVADRAFRELCVEFGAAYVVSEMVSANGIIYNNKNTAKLMELSEDERPASIQLFGADPKVMAKAAKKALEYKPDAIDINMGCPVVKVISNGCGSALMKNPKLCADIVKSIKDEVDVPVTIKIRKGFDDNLVNAVEVACLCEQAGVDAIAVHGRTRQQMYSPPVDLEIIKKVKEAVSVPVIGNGDIFSCEDALNMMQVTGCDFVMVGRGALGNPFIFSQINSYLNKGIIEEKPSVNTILSVMQRHVELICKYKGEKHGIKESRKHVAFYIKGMKSAAKFRNEAGYINTFDDFMSLKDRIYKQNIE